jgi:hypothetical protein
MIVGRSAIMFTTAAVVVLALPVLGAGCGSEPAEFDQAANYTPKALAEELILRYRALNPDAKTSKRGAANKVSAAAIAARDKADRKAVTRTTKKRGPTTIDDIVEDIGYKMALIRGTSRARTAEQMIETISSDNSLAPSDKKVLSEMVGRLAD